MPTNDKSPNSASAAATPESGFKANLRIQRTEVFKTTVAVQKKKQGIQKKKKRKKQKSKNPEDPILLLNDTTFLMTEADREILVNILKELIMMLQYEKIKKSGKFVIVFFILVKKTAAAVNHMQEDYSSKQNRKITSLGQQFSNFFKILRESEYTTHTTTVPIIPDNPVSTVSPNIQRDKIYLPEKLNYNIIGKIIGPRGSNIHQMEIETGCNVLIRGRGSIKNPDREERLRQRNTPGFEHLKEPLHVLITAEGINDEDAEKKLQKCRCWIQKLLKPKSNHNRLNDIPVETAVQKSEILKSTE